MRVLHVSWEYPPLVYGGLGRHVHALAEAQAARGDSVTVLTQAFAGEPDDTHVNGVRVVRVSHDPPALPFDERHLLGWVMSLESSMVRNGIGLVAETNPEVIHAHDWIVAHAAVTLRSVSSGAALVATIHATEAGRHQGWLPGDTSEAVHAIEHWLVHQSDRVITCSQHMRWEVERLFGTESDHVDVVANGVDLARWKARRSDVDRIRDDYSPTGPLVVFCGRLAWEKGVHTLIDALPRLRRRLPGLRVVIAGRGVAAESLAQAAKERRVAGIVRFTGWLPETDLHALMAAADVLVIPSIYEPFGLVALEGAALGAPLVVASTGGLAEFVHDGETGRTFTAGDPHDLARAVTEAISSPEESRAMAARARRVLKDSYQWARLASETDDTYERARTQRAREDRAIAASIPPRGVNLLRDTAT